MTYIIITIDPSTKFLYEIVEFLKKNSVIFNLIEIQPNDESYISSKELISKIEKKSTIIFLGHGRDDKLYGGENLPVFEKKSIVNKEEMRMFEDQLLFLLACNSSDLIKNTFRHSKLRKAVGFGGLPTSKEEIDYDRKLSAEGISEETINKFKSIIIETVSQALLSYFQKRNSDIIYLKDYLTLLIDKRINHAVLVENDRNLGDLLFRMRNEMKLY